jgi:restriction system protein
MLDAASVEGVQYESAHLATVEGIDGEYVIDVVACFQVLGADFRVLVECKHEARKTERQHLQVLLQKIHSTGSHKGMVFSVAGFQAGALEFAKVHGIATVQFAQGTTTWHTRRVGPSLPPPPQIVLPMWVGWWLHDNCASVISETDSKYTRNALGIAQ